jgi:hypothetical protein
MPEMPEVQVSDDDVEALARKMDEVPLSEGSRALLNGIMAVFTDTFASPERSSRDLITVSKEQEQHQPAVVPGDVASKSPGAQIRDAFAPGEIPPRPVSPHLKLRQSKIGGGRFKKGKSGGGGAKVGEGGGG